MADKTAPARHAWPGTLHDADRSPRRCAHHSHHARHHSHSPSHSHSHSHSVSHPAGRSARHALTGTSSSSSSSSPAPSACPEAPRSLGQRRSSALLVRRRNVPLVLLSALLALLLLHEHRLSSSRRGAWAAVPLPVREARKLATSRAEWAARRKRSAERAGNKGGIAELVRADQEAATAWPEWWGSVRAATSPWDYVPRERERVRVLFLTDYDDYRTRANTHTYELIDAALEHPHVDVDVWGPGWAGYDFAVPLSVNVKRRANRLAALDAARGAHDAKRRARRAAAEQAQKRDRWAVWGDVRRAPGRDAAGLRAGEVGRSEGDHVEEGDERWEVPPWTAYEDGCNERSRFGLVWTISDIYKRDDLAHVDVLDCGTLFAQQIGDCHSLRCLDEWYVGANITAVKYAFELQEVFGWDRIKSMYPDMAAPLFGHSPDTGNPWDFWPVPWSEKKRRASIFGFDGSFYPIRTTVTDYLKDVGPSASASRSAVVSRHPHPGYTIAYDPAEPALETYERNHSSYAVQTAIREDFARGLREAQICIFDSSLERKMIRKYAQAFLSGCVVAADLPTEHEEALSAFVIELKPSWNALRIVAELERHLAEPERLEQMAMDAFAYARQHLTTTRKIDGMLDLVDQYRAGIRGYDHPFSFSSRCRAFWSGNAPRPPWCDATPGASHRGLEG
ncbi:hypothetical protein Q5752_000786 [Cryptotrichosporon argae]